MDNTKLLKNTFIYAIGNFGSKILTFLLVPLYSFYINKEDFGYFDLIITAINLIVPFITLQISDGVFRWLVTSNNDNEIIKKTITNGGVVLMFSLLIGSFISVLLYFIYPLKSHWLVSLTCLSAMLFPFIQQVTRGLGKNKLFAINGVVYTVISLVCNIVLLIIFNMSIQALFISNIMAYIISSIIVISSIKIYRFFDLKTLDYDFIKELIKYSIPLVPNTISWWLISSANKYLILLYLGVGANGLFAMSNRFPIVLVMINQVFTLAWQEQAILNYEKQDKKIDNSVLKGLIKVQFILVAILSLISQFVISHILSPEYYDSWKYMPILYLSVSFLSFSGYYGAFYLSTKRTKEIFLTTIYAGTLSVVLGLILVQYIGLYGVAIATLLGYVFLLALRVRDSKKFINIDFPIRVFIKYLVLVIVSFIFCYIENILYSSIILILCCLFVFYDNRNQIKNIAYFIIKKIKPFFKKKI